MEVLIVDDHDVVRSGIKKVLVEMGRDIHFGDASSYQEAVDKLKERRWSAVILDINLPDKSGLELLKKIKRDRGDLPVLVMSMHSEEQYAVRTLRAGAAGYVTKECALDEIVKATKKVIKGERYINEAVAQQLAQKLDESSDNPPHEALSDREYQVLCMIASGKSVSEIADDLSVSVKTVSTYRSRVLSKMSMKHNAELTHYAIKEGLVG